MATNSRKTYAVSCRCEINIKKYIQCWLDSEDSERRVKSVTHVSTEDAYEQILHELSTMDDRFYNAFDVRQLRRSPTRDDWKQFALPEILKMLDVIYQARSYSVNVDDELVEGDHAESDEKPPKRALCTFAVGKLRMSCANRIWRKWTNERHGGPRVGVILISTMEEGAEKVLLISYIYDNKVYVYGFPKGKPNLGEMIRIGCFREFKEEVGVDDLTYDLQINEDDGRVIKKCPHIGPIARQESRAHYYVITTTSTKFKSFRPNKHEILDVEWHSVYMLPCCDHCQIKRRYISIRERKIPVEYHMVTLRDIKNKNSAVLDILAYIDAQNAHRNSYSKYLYTHRRCGNNLS